MPANIIECEKGINIKLIGAMPRKSYVDIAGTLTRSEKKLDEIICMEYNDKLVKKIVSMNHLATTEFDTFIFAVEGLSRVTEIQLVRKRLASYMIKSGRLNKNGKRSFDVVKPNTLKDMYSSVSINPSRVLVNSYKNLGDITGHNADLKIDLTYDDLMDLLCEWYDNGVKQGYPEEDLRYIKPQGTEWKGLICMNGHALLDWFMIRCCKNAQHEIRALANKMLALVKEHSPELFSKAGPSCVRLGYCPENKFQSKECSIITHEQILKGLQDKSIRDAIKNL